ncbi:PKD domain-containing protein [Reichenbachiella sp.]|uniref:PKD domain-containing protein n=1 Tax=Reichenbachiella sp. TaxID=2184521 RepID=UPI003297F071
MKILILGMRLLALLFFLISLQSCDLEDLLEDDDQTESISGSIPSIFVGSWYSESGTYLYEIGSINSDYFIMTGNAEYYYDEYTFLDDVYEVEGRSASGSSKDFYLRTTSVSGVIEISQVSASSGYTKVSEGWAADEEEEEEEEEEEPLERIPDEYLGTWYNVSGVHIFTVEDDISRYIQTNNIVYYFDDENISEPASGITEVVGTSTGGSVKQFYFSAGSSSSQVEISTTSYTEGFNYYWNSISAISTPVAQFSASSQSIEPGQEITFTDESMFVGSYEWTFEGGTPSSSTEKNPVVTYDSPGIFDVTLKVTNAVGSDTEVKNDHITVESPKVIRGFAWCGNPTTSSYTANSGYSFNSEGGSITISRSTTGSYAVTFGGMAMSNSHVQESLYGTSEGAVRVLSWGNSGADLVANVRTFDNAANLADRSFTIFVTGEGFEGAYLYADQESSGGYTPDTSKSYNSSGGSPTISSPSVGTYTVTIPDVGDNLGNVQVTASNAVSAIAKINSWYVSNGDLKVEVRTYHSGTGDLKDAKFNLLFTKSLTNMTGAYCWADLETAGSAYTPLRTGNSSGGGITSQKVSTGMYEVTIKQQAGSGNTILVTGYGANNNKAVIRSWSTNGDDMIATVNTYNSAGTLTDAEFTLFTIYGD